jgi:hypothetical protein
MDNENRKLGTFLVKARLNLFEYNRSLIQKKLLDPSWVNTCLLCEELNSDSIDHWIMECNAVELLRREFIAEIMRIFEALNNANDWKVILSDTCCEETPKLTSQRL